MPQTLGMNGSLERIDEEVDWEKFDTLVEGIYSAEEGRPSYPPLMMVKVLLLEQWYNLSDTQMEEALWDRISFRRFLGLGDDTPHYSTISRFRTELARRGLSKKLFEELGSQLNRHGLMVKEGTLMDATLVAAQVRRPPMSAGRGARSSTGGGSQSHFRYKISVFQSRQKNQLHMGRGTPAPVTATAEC